MKTKLSVLLAVAFLSALSAFATATCTTPMREYCQAACESALNEPGCYLTSVSCSVDSGYNAVCGCDYVCVDYPTYPGDNPNGHRHLEIVETEEGSHRTPTNPISTFKSSTGLKPR
jgi:hypothetical protein